MKAVRIISNILYWLSRAGAVLFLVIGLYACIILLLAKYASINGLPIEIEDGHFTIFYPFTKSAFLLGDYTRAYLGSNIFTILFYGIFLWLLGSVFLAFRQEKLFTRKGVARLSKFYILNLAAPVLFILLFYYFGNEMSDITKIMLLHIVIGVFAFFMSAIFKHGVILQEEQDLTF